MLIIFTTTCIQSSQLSYRDEKRLDELENKYNGLHEKMCELVKQGYGTTPAKIIETSNEHISDGRENFLCSCCGMCTSICCCASAFIANNYVHNPNCETIINAIPYAIGLLSGLSAFVCYSHIKHDARARNTAQQFHDVRTEMTKYNSEQLKQYEHSRNLSHQGLSRAFKTDFIDAKKMQ